MKKIQKFAQHLKDNVFKRLEAPRRKYEKTMINNMDNLYGASLIMRHYSQIMPKHFDISPNFQIIKFNIIEGGEFNYKTLWAQTIFETRHSKVDQATKRKDPGREPIPAQS